MNEWTSGYFKIKKLNLNLINARQDCLAIYETVKHRYGNIQVPPWGPKFGNLSTKLFWKYNTFLFSSQELHQLFKEISDFWRQLRPNDQPYYLQSWVNVYDDSKNIGWHHHYEAGSGSWHGYFCVDVDRSKTSYALYSDNFKESIDNKKDYMYNNEELVEHIEEYELANVCGRDNFLFMSPSGPVHRSNPWAVQDRPRITVAFDIVPGQIIDNANYENHWIPLI